MSKICKELKKALNNKPFFNVVGGCGVDTSNGESNCMSKSGIWFKFCPFCGSEIVQERTKDGSWTWYEKPTTNKLSQQRENLSSKGTD